MTGSRMLRFGDAMSILARRVRELLSSGASGRLSGTEFSKQPSLRDLPVALRRLAGNAKDLCAFLYRQTTEIAQLYQPPLAGVHFGKGRQGVIQCQQLDSMFSRANYFFIQLYSHCIPASLGIRCLACMVGCAAFWATHENSEE